MQTIERVEASLYRLPLPTALSDSAHGLMPDFELVVVDVTDSDGVSGTGYTYTVGRGGGAVHSLVGEAADLLVGRDPDAIGQRWLDLWHGLHWGGRGGPAMLAISAFDVALWDAKARRFDTPLWRLLGGVDPAVPTYAGGIDLEFSLPQLIEQADGFLESGFRAIKMKVGRPHLREDVERAHAMREHLGDDFPLMVDVNMGWSVDNAVVAARALREVNLVWLEEPISPDDPFGHVRVLRDGGVPIATGENLHSPYEFAHLMRLGGVSYPEPDVTNVGGITAFRQVAETAASFNLPVTSHGAHDVSVHLLAAARNGSYLETHGFSLDPYIEEPLEMVEGCAIAPDRPGTGIAFDRSALSRYRVSD